MGRWLSVLGSVLLFGCGPSVHVEHRNTQFYERCHSADLDPAVPEEIRQQCWSRWLEHYSDDQPPERVAYVRARASEEVPAPKMMSEVPPPDPERTKEKYKDHRAPRTDRSSVCMPICEPEWHECLTRCPHDRGGCRSACEVEYRTCMGACP